MFERLSAIPLWARSSEQVCIRPSRPPALPSAGWGPGAGRQGSAGPTAELQARPPGLPVRSLWLPLRGSGEQARLSRREARPGMKRPFMAGTKAVCEHRCLASGPGGQSEC